MKRREKKNNKGFSLVELIVVIAIMIVLVAVLAPVLSKYVEQSRRATDVQNANTIAEAILIEATDKNLTKVDSAAEVTTSVADTLKSVPSVKGDAVATPKDCKFYYTYDKDTNVVAVYVGTDSDKTASGNLTDEKITEAYKTAEAGSLKTSK